MYDMIDVSKHQGTFNWNAAYNKGIRHAMIRAGYGSYLSQKDPQFERNVKECERLGIQWGAYWYSYATSPSQAKQEAKVFLQVMKNKKPTMPLAYDIEYEPGILALSNYTRTEMVKSFLGEVEKAGYYGILYASASFIKSYLNYNSLKQYDVWVASYTSTVNCPLPYGIWQYSSKNPLGIPGYGNSLDCNHVYKDYPAIIKNAGLNGWTKNVNTPDISEEEDKENTSKPNTATNTQLITIGPVSNGDRNTIKALCNSLQLVSMGLYIESVNGSITVGPVSSGDAYLIMRKCDELQLTDMGLYRSMYV